MMSDFSALSAAQNLRYLHVNLKADLNIDPALSQSTQSEDQHTLRLCYQDHGAIDAPEVFICLHGHPGWGFTYRKLAKLLSGAGMRVLTVDLMGYGFSDKPAAHAAYSFDQQLSYLQQWLTHLKLSSYTVIGHDLGGMLALALTAQQPNACKRLVLMNTALPDAFAAQSKAYLEWRQWTQTMAHQWRQLPDFIRWLQQQKSDLTLAECHAYATPCLALSTLHAPLHLFDEASGDLIESNKVNAILQSIAALRQHWSGEFLPIVGQQDTVFGMAAMADIVAAIRPEAAILSLPVNGRVLPEWAELLSARILQRFNLLPSIEIDIAQQRLYLRRYDGALLKSYACSTSALGVGEQYGSFQTPRGRHLVRVKVGHNAAENTVFVRRRATGEIFTPELDAQYPERDWNLTRILWLKGLEPHKNRWRDVDTQNRKIYIHGVSDQVSFENPRSKGCINLRNRDVIELFDAVPIGTPVHIF